MDAEKAMFSVEHRYQGEGMWSRGAAPMTQFGASSHARNMRELGFADEARIVASPPLAQPASSTNLVDLRV